jgi:tetratricopeptide (TPR) repeat protein
MNNPSEGNPGHDEEFQKALEAFQQGVSSRNMEQAEAGAWNALVLAGEWAEKHPSPDLALGQKAHECESRGDWAGAENCYTELAAMHEAAGNFPMLCKTHQDLSRLYALLGNWQKADELARAATNASRRTDLPPLQARALQNEAWCAMRLGDLARALATSSEAVSLVDPKAMFGQHRAGALAARARCRVAAGELAEAEQDLEAGRGALLETEVSPIFAGVHGHLAVWWEASAALCSQRNNLSGAVEAWENAVERRRHISTLPQVEKPYALASLARALDGLAAAQDAAGQTTEAQTSKSEARRIREEIGLPGSA